MHLARGRGDQHAVGVRQVPSRRVGLAKGGQGEGHDPADRLRVRGHAHGQRGVVRPVGGPAQRLQVLCGGAALQLGAEDVALLGAAEGVGLARPGKLSEVDRLPLRDHAEHAGRALGGEVGLGAGQVEVQDRLPAHGHPWMSQPSAARAASMTASESVGWPWTMR